MDDDFKGRIWTRREVFRVFGAAGLALLGGCGDHSSTTDTSSSSSTSGTSGSGGSSAGATTSGNLNVIATPELTEGPFFVDEKLERSDLIAGSARSSVSGGLPFELALGVYSLATGSPVAISGAQVDVWHADAVGAYSDVASGSVQSEDTRGENWLRGYQLSDASGQVAFDTIYPGWYVGRAIHIHFKVRIAAPAREFTSQLFFDPALNDAVMATAAYSGRGARSVRNSNDSIYQALHGDGQPVGDHLLLATTAQGSGYRGTFNVGIA